MKFLSKTFITLLVAMIVLSFSTLKAEETKSSPLKISGYIQAQFQHTSKETGFKENPYNPAEFVKDRFILRRARLKFKYIKGLMGFVFQTDFTNKGGKIKDAYIKLSDPWSKVITFKAGVFNRPFYEVEYSSSKRESPERASVTGVLYHGECDLGFGFVIKPKGLFQLDLTAFNNTYETMYKQFLPNFGDYPFYGMIRLKKNMKFGNHIKMTLGAHTRIGNMSANTKKVILPESDVTVIDTLKYKVGDGLSRTWYGVNTQLHFDFLSGIKIAAAYLWGNNVDKPAKDGSAPLRMRNFAGYYIYFIKNIGKEWQAVVKYDSYDPNTAINDANISSKNDLTHSTIGFGIHNYSFTKFRLSLWYDMVSTQTNGVFKESPVNNVLTFRAQMKF